MKDRAKEKYLRKHNVKQRTRAMRRKMQEEPARREDRDNRLASLNLINSPRPPSLQHQLTPATNESAEQHETSRGQSPPGSGERGSEQMV
jgi:hypothetical protein